MPGDHLDRATFHTRYEAMPEGTKWELLQGVVFMSALYAPHALAHSEAVVWLGLYKAATPGVELLDNASTLLAPDGEPQPDASLIIESERGGQTWLEGDWLAGAPELVVEVAYSSESYDLHIKRDEYEAAGVREYVVVMLREQRVVWFARRGERFEELPDDDDGLLRLEIFPGLWLDPAALLRRDTAAVRQSLEQGLATPEHAEFVAQLQR
jgi:Uma2 family endonuclease